MTDPLTGKNVVILGLARQGKALAEWLCEVGANVTVSDLRSEDQLRDALKELDGLPIRFVLGEHPPHLLTRADLLCLSGGVPVEAPLVRSAVEMGIPLSNDAQIFMERCPCHVVGITGSAGKTTTTALVGRMFEEAGMLPWVGGNIGNPLIADLPYMKPGDVAVMELSSFQLEIMTTSPHIGAVLNVTPNHLDRHKTMETYIKAKAHILDHQIAGDVAVLGRDDPNAWALRERVEVDVAAFSMNFPVDVGAWLVGDKMLCRPTFTTPMDTLGTIDEIPLRGQHNVRNVLAACAIAGAAGVGLDAMRRAFLAFQPVEHRLEVVREWMGITWINDSIATAPERVQAALEAFHGESLVLLLGGRDKDLPWGELVREAVRACHAIITFGEAGLMIAEKVAAERAIQGSDTQLEQTTTLEGAVDLAASVADEGDIVLLSPGGTSYDAYEDFAARGEHFRELVRRL